MATSSSGNTGSGADKDTRWYFTAEQLANSPSRRQGIDVDQELSFRQLTAYLIQEMGQRLQVSQLCINTAIVYMHRFYAFHSFTHFHRNGIAAASLFLAAKVEEQPRKLEHVIKVAHICLNQEPPHPSSKIYAEQAQDLVFNENVLLQTLGFDVAIDHPHTHVVKTCHLVKACKDLAQTSYFLASNSLHLTSMCLQYRPTVVACFCIYLACKWSRWEIPQSTEGKHWFHYVDKTVTMELLQQLTDEFIVIYEKSPARLKSKLNSIKALAQSARIPEPSRSDSINGSNSSQLEQLTPIPAPPSRRDPSSHHRPHHSGSSHHHHSKHPPPIDPGDHKHKIPFPTSSSSNRPRTDRSQAAISGNNAGDSTGQQYVIPNKQARTSSSSGRPQTIVPSLSQSQTAASVQQSTAPVISLLTSSNAPIMSTSGSGQRNIHGHDQSGHHKNRVSSGNTNLSQLNPSINAASNHKVATSKVSIDQSNRNSLREISKFPTQSKHSSGNNSNNSNNNSGVVGTGSGMYPPQSVANQQNHQTNNALEIRNLLSQQSQNQHTLQSQNRTFTQNSQQVSNYQHHQNVSASNRNNNNISNNNNGNKYIEQQSVQQPLLVHVQQQQQQQKQSIESSSLSLPFNMANDPTSNLGKNPISGAGDQMEICSPPKYSTGQQHQQQPSYLLNQSQQQQQQQQNAINTKPFSIFSPEWNDKQQQQLQPIPNSIMNQNSANSSSNNKSLNFNMKNNRDSPKKLSSDKDKKSGTPKKDKRNNIEQQQQQQQQQQLQQQRPKQMPIGLSQQNMQYPPQQMHALNFSAGLKRPIPSSGDSINNNSMKLVEEELLRETKVRKLDPVDIKPPPYLFETQGLTPTGIVGNVANMGNNFNYQSSSSQQLHQQQQQQQQQDLKVKQFSTSNSMLNGSIETNPDMVSSLLKESLCNENKFSSHIIKTETPSQLSIKHDSSDYTMLSQVEMSTLPLQLLQEPASTPKLSVKNESVSGGGNSSNDEFSKSKSEKKKKKDKHKHKEKDKSKDKEERKKHKKDKEKHKERDRLNITENLNTNDVTDSYNSGTIEQNPFKLKISKDKLNFPTIDNCSTGSLNSGQFKIKIPKDRIKNDINFVTNNDGSTLTGQNVLSGSGSVIGTNIGNMGQNYINQTVPTVSSLKIKLFKDKGENNSFHGSSGGGSGSGAGGTVGNASSSSGSNKKKDRDKDKERKKSDKQNGSGGNMTTSKNQSNSSKIQQYSQLFGESNDDDDDDIDNYTSTSLNATNAAPTVLTNQYINKQQQQQQQHVQQQHKFLSNLHPQQPQQLLQYRFPDRKINCNNSSSNITSVHYSDYNMKKLNNNFNNGNHHNQQQQQQHHHQQQQQQHRAPHY